MCSAIVNCNNRDVLYASGIIMRKNDHRLARYTTFVQSQNYHFSPPPPPKHTQYPHHVKDPCMSVI